MSEAHYELERDYFVPIFEALTGALTEDRLGTVRGGGDLILDRCIALANRRAIAMQIGKEDAAKAFAKARAAIARAYIHCESPIEKRILPALVFAYYGEQFATFPAEVHCPKDCESPPQGDVVIVPQFAFVKHRLDFAIIGEFSGHRKIVGVECDGREYHPDPKIDAVRDRYLRGFGIDVLRFTGAEIQHDPLPLAAKAASILVEWRASL